MKQYYEGWYMKQQQGREVLAVIPGRAADEAFIQVITQTGSYYIPYPLQSYKHSGVMRVGKCLFSRYGMRLDINTPQLVLRGELYYSKLTPLKYGIMGPFEALPLETKHTVFSMRHTVRGQVELNGKLLSFTGGVGYMEGDRGHSFPNGYTWLQSVDFGTDASVMLAIAGIPLLGRSFTGCIAVVYLKGQQFRFATYLGVRVEQSSATFVRLAQGDMRLEVQLLSSRGHTLQAPVKGQMQRPIQESPGVPANFLFTKHGEVLLEATSHITSFEHVKKQAED